MRKPQAREVYETEVESEQEQDATDEETLKCEVRSAAEVAFFDGWRGEQQTVDIRKARCVQELPSNTNANSCGGKETGVARDDRPRDHRDDRSVCENLGHRHAGPTSGRQRQTREISQNQHFSMGNGC